jgi:uncharacterized protein (DUF488 family)
MAGERTHARPGRQDPPDLWTIGHSTLTLDAFVGLLQGAGVAGIADVRRYPASRRNPQFNRETLAAFLDARGVAYRWFEDLGGRRSGDARATSPNLGLENAGFRAYADYTATETFRAAFDALLAWAAERPTAVLCAEALWWRCHRRLIADLWVDRGGEVVHVYSDGKREPHTLWDLARREGDGLVYPPEQGELGLSPPQRTH